MTASDSGTALGYGIVLLDLGLLRGMPSFMPEYWFLFLRFSDFSTVLPSLQHLTANW